MQINITGLEMDRKDMPNFANANDAIKAIIDKADLSDLKFAVISCRYTESNKLKDKVQINIEARNY